MRNLTPRFNKLADEVIGFAGGTWEQKAKQAAPKDQGRLVNEIRSVKRAQLKHEVVVNSEQAPWMEWGTKRRVRVPSDLTAYAATFKGKYTKGKVSAKKAIFEWCKRKGIDKKAWYSIYRSIMVNGVKPHPFFFIQRPAVQKQLLQDLRDVLTALD